MPYISFRCLICHSEGFFCHSEAAGRRISRADSRTMQREILRCAQDDNVHIQDDNVHTRNDDVYTQDDKNDNSIDFILEFYVAGQIGLITYWMQHPEQISQETFFSLMQDMIFRGPLTVLKERVSQDVFASMGDGILPHTP